MNIKEYKKNESKELINNFIEEYYTLTGSRPIVSLIKGILLVKILDKELMKKITLSELEDIINKFIPINFKIENKIILSIKHPSRKIHLVELRHIFSHIARKMGYTLTEIGDYLNNKDHTTVINSLRQFDNWVDSGDILFISKYEEILNEVNTYIKLKENGNDLLYNVDEESIDSQSTLSTVLL